MDNIFTTAGKYWEKNNAAFEQTNDGYGNTTIGMGIK